MGAFTYIYILQSETYSDRFYVGQTQDLRVRLAQHNAGRIPLHLKMEAVAHKILCRLSDKQRALALERYLKSASGRAFAKKRL